MMKKHLLLFVILLSCISLKAQQVISSAGESYKNGNVSLSWTLGEPVIKTLSNNSVVLTQGFQQGSLSTNAIKEIFKEGLDIEVYPNPAANDLNLLLKRENYSTMRFYLHNMEGEILTHGLVENDLTKINIFRYPHGIYLLRIVKKSGESVQSFRIVKQ